MLKKALLIVVIAAMLCASGCVEETPISTSVGAFYMSSDTAESFRDSFGMYTPAAGSEFLLIYLTPESPEMTIDVLESYFRPTPEKVGPVATIQGIDYQLRYLAYGDAMPPTCVLIYEVPAGNVDMENITLSFPA